MFLPFLFTSTGNHQLPDQPAIEGGVLNNSFRTFLLRKKVDPSHGKTAMIVPSQGVREEEEGSVFELMQT